jgi:hypothetical protein
LIRRSILFILLGSCAISGCNKGNPVSSNPNIKNIYFTISEAGLRYPRAGEHYFLWIKTVHDTSWQEIAQVDTFKFNDTTYISKEFSSDIAIDSITAVQVTLQPSNVSVPILDFPVLEGHSFSYDSAHKTTVSPLISKKTLGDFSAMQGGLVFTSTKPDSLAYTHEFYLMNYTASLQTPSLLSLPVPPNGWKYGLWAIDSAFTPHEFFFYGLFTNPSGHDSDSTNDYYPFPGGWKPQQMNFGNGSIIVTLEPLLYGDSLKYKGPSPFTLLNFNRILFIEKNRNYPMTNISAQGVPNGYILFRHY